MSEMSCDDDRPSSKCSIRYQRDLRKEYEHFIKSKMDLFDLELMFDKLIKENVINSNFLDLIECAYRFSIIKGFVHETPILKRYLENEKCGCNNIFDYLECITIIHYIVNRRSFNCLFI